MEKADKLAQELAPVAGEVLEVFGQISEAVKKESAMLAGVPVDVFANTANSTFTSPPAAAARLVAGRYELQRDAEQLRREPAIARVSCHDGEKECVTYICRGAPPSVPGFDLVSQRAPRGRLAALAVGDSLTLPTGRTLEVLERLEVHPEQISGGWDSKNNILRLPSKRPITIESLRALLGTATVIVQDLLAQLVAEENKKNLIREGQKRAVLTSMQLRDQAILDAHQDEIFRLPIDQQIFLSGPPGTGKTTTLIRRLGQKLDFQFLNEDEQNKVRNAALSSNLDHANSWLMFTPTELLRQYVKEAFSREQIPASDQNIRTWEEFRRDASRNSFNILRSAVNQGLVFRPGALTTSDEVLSDQIGFHEDFDTWQRQLLFERIQRAASALELTSIARIAEVGRLIRVATEKSSTTTIGDIITLIERYSSELRGMAEDLLDKINTPIEGALNKRLNRDQQFIANLVAFLQQANTIDEADLDDLSEEDEEEEEESNSGTLAAINGYKRALRVLARSLITKRRIGTGTRAASILEFIGKDELLPAELESIGDAIVMRGHARTLLTMTRRYVFDTGKRYRAYRRTRQREKRWFHQDLSSASEVNEIELDSILLSSLRASRDLLGRIEVRSNLNGRPWDILQPVFALYRNQVLADEATDFSPLQLASMTMLTHPSVNSFFAAGDFHQRLTPWGIADSKQLAWLAPNITRREITALFRQSHRLQDLSASILGTFAASTDLPGISADTVGNEVAPVLLEAHGDTDNVSAWLASRIREIEASLGQLPTLAVFVSNENEVEPLAAALNRQFETDNLQAVACVRGQIKGLDTDVRVFDIQHVKGLEFEAAFFVGIDVLAQHLPVDFARYLYVGATRAATYLGVTCAKQLPDLIEPLRDKFTPDWKVDL